MEVIRGILDYIAKGIFIGLVSSAGILSAMLFYGVFLPVLFFVFVLYIINKVVECRNKDKCKI